MQTLGCFYPHRNCRVRVVLLCLGLLCAILCPSWSSLRAQVVSGIKGTVSDTSGAVIPRARVTITNTATGVNSYDVTSAEGTFTVIGLNPGEYTVTVDAPQFKRDQTRVTVEVTKVSAISVQLAPGMSSETIQVTASSIALETTSPVIGTTLEPELVKTAPIEINSLARQIDSFIFLAPGVGGTASAHWINGGITFENEVQFNGVPVAFVDYAGNQTYINPPYEAVSEFRVNSSTFDARYGLGQGAVTYNMASGTNRFHGDGFEILRNQLFDSTGFFPTNFDSAGRPIPPVDQQNNYGFTLGGPIIIPKLYNGKKRSFFYISQDWFKQNQAQTGIGTVPTAAMKSGDFSNFVDSSGNVIPIYDPLTGQPFPQNIIPQSRFSALANAILPLVPDPNRAGLNSGNLDNESPAIHSVPIRQHLWSYTLDHNLSASQSIHFSQWRDTVTSPFLTAAPIVSATNDLQSEANNSEYGEGYLANYAKTISPNLVVTAGGDWIRNINAQENARKGVNFGGVTGSSTFPLIEFDGQNAPTWWGVNGNANINFLFGGMTQVSNRKLGVVLVNNWLWTKGRNSFNFGGEFRRTYQNLVECQFCGGTFSFSQRTTTVPDGNDPNFGTYGSSFASFLLGEVDSGERILANELHFRNKAFASYLQDDIKLTKRLTVNVGLRWDIMVPFTETNNDIVYLNVLNPIADPGAGGIPGGAQKYGHCAECTGMTRAPIHWKNLQPRVGFAYEINPKTAVRAGFFITYLDGGAYEYGTAQTGIYYSSLLNGEFGRLPSGGSAPGYGSWDANPMPLPQATPFTTSIGNGGIIMNFDPNQAGRAPYDQAWNFGIQRQLPWDMFLGASYVGNRAIHLPVTLIQPNQAPVSVLSYGNLLNEQVTSADAMAAGIKIPYPDFVQQFGTAATVLQALEPFPQYAGVYNIYETDGTAFYNALQVQMEKRFAHGLSYLAGFTFARNMANTQTGSTPFSPNGENSFNERPEYAPSSLDQKYVTNIVTTYELPLGYGKRFLNSKGIWSNLAGGWQVSAILGYSGGFPMGAYNSYNPLGVNGFDRPNVAPGVSMKTYDYGLSKAYFEGKSTNAPEQITTNAFTNTTAFQFGDAKRSYAALRTPPLRIENFNAIKSFSVAERVKLSLRVDYFNAFNRTQLQGPDMNSLDSTFGQITNLSSQISNRQGEATFRVEF